MDQRWPVSARVALIGRSHEAAQLRALIANEKWVVVRGPIGIGKTRLVHAVVGAERVLEDADGRWEELAELRREALAHPQGCKTDSIVVIARSAPPFECATLELGPLSTSARGGISEAGALLRALAEQARRGDR